MEYNKILAQLRQKSGFTQKQVSDMMTARGRAVSNAVISKWESGLSMPDMDAFLTLCSIYEVDDIGLTFTGRSRTGEDLLGGLNFTGRRHARRLIEFLHSDEMFTATEPPRRQHRYLKLYDLPASAGSGSYLDSDAYKEIMVDDTVPESAGYAVRVSGDSMEPRFIDGQIAFVKPQLFLDIGDIGVFSLDNEAFIKKWGGDSLVSLNKKYKPIELKEWSDLRIFGKVVGG